jgi:hypothetical protein
MAAIGQETVDLVGECRRESASRGFDEAVPGYGDEGRAWVDAEAGRWSAHGLTADMALYDAHEHEIPFGIGNGL